ncbi:hypothetical protein FA09DRAFT_340247 [Tilletiopsis washingtonensis]|uniref:Uncharacterized protein n=1 Tax=Tilletiopsis washingtonensis TaxID=58919 RepID=A0A316Z668_9BASI|nr:hypothetical protein FA09DRAFT_340247 [Tilletiopsis washingtonensis]PWN96452.1 hypothetical protein FA09DRAFT_340247 [Tilletiopsis washingtonensis]
MAPKRKPKDETPTDGESAPKQPKKPRGTGAEKGAWTDPEIITALFSVLAYQDVKLTKPQQQAIGEKLGRSANSVGCWWYQKAQTQINAARAELTGDAKSAGDTKPSSS